MHRGVTPGHNDINLIQLGIQSQVETTPQYDTCIYQHQKDVHAQTAPVRTACSKLCLACRICCSCCVSCSAPSCTATANMNCCLRSAGVMPGRVRVPSAGAESCLTALMLCCRSLGWWLASYGWLAAARHAAVSAARACTATAGEKCCEGMPTL